MSFQLVLRGQKPSEAWMERVNRERLRLKEEQRKREEYLKSLVAADVKRREEQRQKAIERAKEKALHDDHRYRQVRTTIHKYKADEQNQAMIHQKAEQKKREKAESRSTCEYEGGMLSQHEEREQKRLHQNQHLCQAAEQYNRECARQKQLDKQRKPPLPPIQPKERKYSTKKRARQAHVYNTYTENLAQKEKAVEEQQRKASELEERCKQFEADREARYQKWIRSNQEESQKLQSRNEAVSKNLSQVKEQEAARARREEEKMVKAQIKALPSLSSSRKTDKDTTAHLLQQMQLKEEQKKAEAKAQRQLHQQLVEEDRLYKQSQQQEIEKQRQRNSLYMQGNVIMAKEKRETAERQQREQKEAEQREAQLRSQDEAQFEEYVEKLTVQGVRVTVEPEYRIPKVTSQEAEEKRVNKQKLLPLRPSMEPFVRVTPHRVVLKSPPELPKKKVLLPPIALKRVPTLMDLRKAS